MNHVLYLAWRYLVHHKAKTIVLIISLTLLIALPLSLRVLVRESERRLKVRATSTPLLIGAEGSTLDLAISSLYFEPKPVKPIPVCEVDYVCGTGLAEAIPLYVRFQARGYPIVGTSLDYFDFRGLRIAHGRQMTSLGECVLGATVAEKLSLGPGDKLTSSPENPYDLSATYPLRMRIAGILSRSHSPDDRAVFVDLKTAWIIQGLGHGHQDLSRADGDVLLESTGNQIKANAKLIQFNEITEANADSFHFHGDSRQFPITAVLAVPKDRKSEDLLRGRYQSVNQQRQGRGKACTAWQEEAEKTTKESRLSLPQAIRPKDVIEGLTTTIFRVEGVLNVGFGLLGIATVLLLVLVVLLSLRLRQREMVTLVRLGCGHWRITAMVMAELGMVLVASAVIALSLTFILSLYVEEILHRLIL